MLRFTNIFRNISKYEIYKGYRNVALENFNLPGYTIIRNKEDIYKLLDILDKNKNKIHSWDTETIDVDAKLETPVNKGKIISAQLFIGPEIDFGSGPRVFIDNFGDCYDNILYLKEYFEDNNYKKIWFNYGYDRHIFYNHGINCKGFAGDVMHMARLSNPSRGMKEYSLAALSSFYQEDIMNIKEMYNKVEMDSISRQNVNNYFNNFKDDLIKTKMSKIFARRKILKNGELSKIYEMPEIEEIHTSPDLINKWVEYSCLDAELTYFLREVLIKELKELPTNFEDCNNLFDIYKKYWLPFGELLTDIERNGFYCDYKDLSESLVKAKEEYKKHNSIFSDTILKLDSEAYNFNPSSNAQLQQLLFAPFTRKKVYKKIQNTTAEEKEEEIRKKTEELESDPLKQQRNFTILNEYPIEREFKILITDPSTNKTKYETLVVRGYGIPPISYSESGLPSVEISALVKLLEYLENPDTKHYKAINSSEIRENIKNIIFNLVSMRQIETLQKTFIEPLLELCENSKDNRIHCSLNINTETGRLSSRKPNLQNLPALEKDKFYIRKSFKAEPGNKLIIADYGQLELRLLAHICNCKKMIEAFEQGGDFHSRTAYQMFDYIKKEVDNNQLIIDDIEGNKDNLPNIKNKYPNERKKAKTMNFSIAYGKSAIGFAKDWNCDLKEAQEYLDKWYESRSEVKEWQEKIKKNTVEYGYSQTIFGRFRDFSKDIGSKNKLKIMHAMRSCINTPIQGSAADLMMACMVKLYKDDTLKKYNWNMIHQVHDEIIFEGPEDSATKVLKIIENTMKEPFYSEKLLLNLDVDIKICDNWYEKS